MLQRRPSSLATMLGIVVLVAVVLVLLMQPGRAPVQPADFAALSADDSYTAKTSSTGDGFTLTMDLDAPGSAAGQTVYQGSYGSIVLEAVTDVSETGCTLQRCPLPAGWMPTARPAWYPVPCPEPTAC